MHSQDWLEKCDGVRKLAVELRSGFNPPHGEFDVKVRTRLDHVLSVTKIPTDPFEL